MVGCVQSALSRARLVITLELPGTFGLHFSLIEWCVLYTVFVLIWLFVWYLEPASHWSVGAGYMKLSCPACDANARTRIDCSSRVPAATASPVYCNLFLVREGAAIGP